MSQETYSVAALAAAVGVPRTTINDWLSRYADYIDCTAVGKRKVYSEASLSVLKEIAKLRDAGKSSAEIEIMLAQNHGVRPEVATPPADAPAPGKSSVTAPGEPNNSNVPAVTELAENAQLPALKNIEQSAMELAEFITDMRRNHQQSVKRFRWITVTMAAAIVLLLGAVLMVYATMRSENATRQKDAELAQQQTVQMQQQISELNRKNAADAQLAQQKLAKLSEDLQNEAAGRKKEAELARQENRELQDKLATQSKQLGDLSSSLKEMESDRRAGQEQLRKLRSDLEQNKEQYKLQIRQLEKELAAARQAQLNAEKLADERKQFSDRQQTEFARQRKSDAESARKNREQLDSLQKKFDAATEQLNRIDRQLEKLNGQDKKPAAPAQS